ncbi:MAG: hypothetical protein OXO51_18155, partial [Gemmatimonadota bacterium]|nr:hypothetical protein [Gemmatimonadota bacterium]
MIQYLLWGPVGIARVRTGWADGGSGRGKVGQTGPGRSRRERTGTGGPDGETQGQAETDRPEGDRPARRTRVSRRTAQLAAVLRLPVFSRISSS